ncbi:MAG: YlmH family RNA-binding protein [Stomatobaculum sp.]|nr:YlmH family RNA-binding protein [Stomatobaculum sp.]
MTDKEEAFFRKRILDLEQSCYQKNIETHSLFLNAEEQTVLRTMHLSAGTGKVVSAGGFDDAERRIVCFLPDYIDEVPENIFAYLRIAPVSAKFADDLSHRDFLGALMSLGIRREMVGDISIADNTAHVVVLRPVAGTILENLTSVRHTSVLVSEERPEDLKLSVRTEERSVNTASFRIDAMIAAVYHVSRSTAAELLRGGRVFLNSAVQENGAVLMKPGDILTVRGKGRFRLLPDPHPTKKGRMYSKIEVFL